MTMRAFSEANFSLSPTLGQAIANDILINTGGDPVKVADAIISIITQASVAIDMKAGFLRFFTGAQLQALKEKAASLKTTQNMESFTQIFNAAIHSSSDATIREKLLEVKNAFLSTSTSALSSPVEYPVTSRTVQPREVGQYLGNIESLDETKARYQAIRYPSQVNVTSDAAIIKEMLGVEQAATVTEQTNVAEFVAGCGEQCPQALHTASGLIKELEIIGKRGEVGSLLRGVCDTIRADLLQCRDTFLRGDSTPEQTLKTHQKMCALLREAECVITAQGKGVDAFAAKKALMLLKLQNLHCKYDQFSHQMNKANVSELQGLSEKLGRFGIHDPSLFTRRLFTEDELKGATIDTLKDSMDVLVDTMKRSMTEEEWTKNTSREGGRSQPFSALEQELITDFNILIRTVEKRTS